MDLVALGAYLKGKGDPLTLDANDSFLPQQMRDFLGGVPNKRVTLSPSHGGGINGTTATLTVAGASSDSWPIQGMTNVAVTLSDLTITITNGSSAPTFAAVAHASLPLTASISAPVTLTTLQQQDNPWQIALSQNAAGVTPTELLQLGQTNALPFTIPANLDVLNQALTVTPDSFQIVFYPNTTFESRMTVSLSAPQAQWTLISSMLEFNGIDISAYVMTSSISVILTGHLTIDSVAVDVGVALNTGNDWVAFIKPPGDGAFPGLAALGSWIGGGALSGNVTSGFQNVNFNTGSFDAAIAKISLGFNVQTLTLNYLDIKSLLTIGALQLDVSLRLPDIQVIGSLHAGQPVKITDMLTSVGLPIDDVPANLSITAVDFDAQPGDSYYLVDMAVDNVWQAGPVTLQNIALLVVYDGANGFSGQFNCSFDISTLAEFDLEAAYVDSNTGWLFAGSLDSGSGLDIGSLVAAVSQEFGIPALPSPVKQFNLTQLSISYTTGSGQFAVACACELVGTTSSQQIIVAPT